MNIFSINNSRILGLLYFVLFCIVSHNSFAQHYYAKDGAGELELLNDSMYTISFYSDVDFVFVDTGRYTTRGDTIFLTSRTLEWCEIIDLIDTTNHPLTPLDGYVVRCYRKSSDGDGWIMKFEWISTRGFHEYDGVTISIPRVFQIYPGEILIVHSNFGGYQRCLVNMKKSGFSLKIKKRSTFAEYSRVYLDRFAMIKSKGELVPIDETQQYLCWVNNGFKFPVMQKRKTKLLKQNEGYRGQWGIERQMGVQ